MKKIPIIFIFCALSAISNAQSSYQYGIIPSINLHKKIPGNWSTNFKLESRQSIYKQDFKYEYLLTDLSLIVTKRIATNITVGGGYLLRIEDDKFKNRAIQQIGFSKKFPSFRMAHRIMTDQTFEKNENTEFRLRYRISSEIPLEGQSIDVNEFYLKINNEYLNSLQGVDYDLEVRGVVLLGYSVSALNDVEIGIDYRLDSFVSGNPRNRTWLSINFFHSLGK
ncbi:hypothetical protein A9168_02970 [Macellibacteroides sp. HH-ZS]|jgi:hypothetical protein|nr:DUF2490 domain-containing protein [Bacteroidaceae bacterium]OCW95628.1 hypothetical protein A9168_02970 [Macellibacteroides sp. HH-ZS]